MINIPTLQPICDLQLQHPVPLGDPQPGHLVAVGHHIPSPVVHEDSLAGTITTILLQPENYEDVNEHKYLSNNLPPLVP